MIVGKTLTEAQEVLEREFALDPEHRSSDFQKRKRLFLISNYVDCMPDGTYESSAVFVDDENDENVVIELRISYADFTEHIDEDFFFYIRYIDRVHIVPIDEGTAALRFVFTDVFGADPEHW